MQTPTEPSRIWAKSPEKGGGKEVTLREHTQHVLNAFDGLKDKVNPPRLQELIRLAIICHDFGKLLPAFQTRTLSHKEYRPFRVEPNPPHSLVSVLWMNQEKLKQTVGEKLGAISSAEAESYARFVVSAVAYHHWRENFNELIRYGDTPLGRLCELWTSNGDTETLQHNLENELSDLDSNVKDIISFNREMAEGICNGAPFSRYVIPPYQLYWLPARIPVEDERMRDWILIAGFLMRCDHYASFLEKEGLDSRQAIEVADSEPSTIEDRIAVTLGKPKEDIWQIEKTTKSREQNTILIAPTGFGKTEFAFLWSGGKKFFYTLPLRSAVNQIFERTRSIFAGDKRDERVGLLHSDADVYLIGDGAESENLRVYDLSRQLSYPVIVSTGDQFFPYALRPPGYEKIFATFSYSGLVIDEVQAYDPRAAAIVVKFVEDVVRMGGKFLLMTATLPEFVQKAINNSLEKIVGKSVTPINVYEEHSDLKKLVKHQLEFKIIPTNNSEGKTSFKLPDSELDDVLGKANEGNRVLVILNTVKQAQDVYGRLKENASAGLRDKVWLLHSRFTFDDRRDLELELCGDKERIRRKETGEFENPKPADERIGKILVATQVVEASLDIDADILFTELAPMDSLVQRMGRVLRRKREDFKTKQTNVYVWVFSHGWESGNGRVYEKELLYKTMRLLLDPEKSESSAKELTYVWQDVKWNDITIDPASVVQPPQAKGKTKKEEKVKKNAKDDKPSAENLIIPAGKTVLLSEYQKYLLVKHAYLALSPEGRYLTRFYETLQMLNAGYMSDRKEEAQRIFREIRSIDVIPSNKKEEFLLAVEEFFKEHGGKGRQYTYFKKQILSKFVVSTPFRSERFGDLSREKLDIWFDGMRLDKDDKRRLTSWCREVYIVDARYDKHGLVLEKQKDDRRFIGW